jgi:hypothetical protein
MIEWAQQPAVLSFTGLARAGFLFQSELMSRLGDYASIVSDVNESSKDRPKVRLFKR